jgi:hypothetical protein
MLGAAIGNRVVAVLPQPVFPASELGVVPNPVKSKFDSREGAFKAANTPPSASSSGG